MPWILATLTLFMLGSCPAHADVYTWIDSRGIAHFSDYPPGKLPHRRLEIEPPATVPMAENLRRGKRITGIREEVEGLLSAPDRASNSRERRQAKALAKQEKACGQYRNKLDRIQSRLRAGYSNDKGNALRRQRRSLSQKLSRECILR